MSCAYTVLDQHGVGILARALFPYGIPVLAEIARCALG
jgi:hypothetical protein